MGQLGSLRCIIALITLLALGPVSLFPVATVFAQNAGPGAGLMEESSYVSPQFGYSVTWESPWTADPRLTTSVADRYDTLRLDARAAAMMRSSLGEAQRALAKGNVAAMARCYEDLKGYEA